MFRHRCWLVHDFICLQAQCQWQMPPQHLGLCFVMLDRRGEWLVPNQCSALVIIWIPKTCPSAVFYSNEFCAADNLENFAWDWWVPWTLCWVSSVYSLDQSICSPRFRYILMGVFPLRLNRPVSVPSFPRLLLVNCSSLPKVYVDILMALTMKEPSLVIPPADCLDLLLLSSVVVFACCKQSRRSVWSLIGRLYYFFQPELKLVRCEVDCVR